MKDEKKGFEESKETKNLWLRYDFNEEELKTMARDLSEALNKKKNLEDEAKSAAASYKSSIAEKTAQINKLSNLYGTGYESRNIPCKIFYNWELDIKRFVRSDTGEIVREEKIPEEDRQMKVDELKKEEDQKKENDSKKEEDRKKGEK